MKVNGQAQEVRFPLTLAQYLQQAGYDSTRVAVERNGEIIPKATFQDLELSQTDSLEIVHFVGGG